MLASGLVRGIAGANFGVKLTPLIALVLPSLKALVRDCIPWFQGIRYWP